MDKIIEQATKTLKEVGELEDILFSVVDNDSDGDTDLGNVLDKACELSIALRILLAKYEVER